MSAHIGGTMIEMWLVSSVNVTYPGGIGGGVDVVDAPAVEGAQTPTRVQADATASQRPTREENRFMDGSLLRSLATAGVPSRQQE
jgi:hypothetical protein